MKVMIQQALEKRGKTLYRLSEDLGIPLRTVYDWQLKNKMPRQDYLDQICNYLTCDISELLKPERFDYGA
jgi:transcriptional regulator with XRE-family HTH domain